MGARGALAAALLAALLSRGAPAAAHARPAALTAIAQRADGSVVASATWGLVFRDGERWSLGCAAAYGVDANTEDAELVLDGEGRLVLGTFHGLYESADGCHFTQPAGALAEGWVVAVAADGAGGVHAVLTDVAEPDRLYHREAGGGWSMVGEPLDALVTDLRVDGSELWLASFSPRSAEGPPRVFLARSADGGVTRQSWELALETSEYAASLLAVRDGVVHLVVRHFEGPAVAERLLRFDAAAETFELVHRAPQLEAGAWTAEGLWVISRIGGLELAPDGRSFERRHELAGRCLGVVDGALFACADPARDGMALARVTPEAIAPVLELATLDRLRECPAESATAALCPAYREALAEDVGVPVDGVPPPGAAGGCAVSERGRAGWVGALALAWIAQRRRRRTRSRARPIRPKP